MQQARSANFRATSGLSVSPWSLIDVPWHKGAAFTEAPQEECRPAVNPVFPQFMQFSVEAQRGASGGGQGPLRGRCTCPGAGRPYPDDVTVLTRPALAQFLLLGACLSPSLPTGGFKVSPRVILKLIEAGWNNIYSIIKLLCMHAKSLQSCPTLCKPMDYSPPGSSVHGILQARKLEWVAMPSSRRSSWLRDRTWVSYVFCIDSLFLCH